MKKANVINLIRYHMENNEPAFRQEAIEIAKAFDRSGDHQLATYIMAQLSDANVFVPQGQTLELTYLEKIESSQQSIYLPDAIQQDIKGIINAILQNIGINKFLFEGAPGSGKTETVKHISRILKRDLYQVNFERVIDSRLGETPKNISQIFAEAENLSQLSEIILLFDEIDALALDRINSRDVREMGRATSALLKGLDQMSEKIVLIATTNLYESFDKALLRRFDYIVNFNRYSQEELIEIAEAFYQSYHALMKYEGKDLRLFRKILKNVKNLPYPGDFHNLIRSTMAFSNPKSPSEFYIRFYEAIMDRRLDEVSVQDLSEQGFTTREIGILKELSKSQISRILRGEADE